jgi:hypothetical protein
MMTKFYFFLPLFLWVCLHALFSQQTVHHQLIEELIEELQTHEGTDLDPTLIYDNLSRYILNPVNINTADAEEFRSLYFINELQIANILSYRQEQGQFQTLYELQYIEGFSYDDIRKILPFITIEETARAHDISPAEILRFGRHQYFIRLQRIVEEQRGFSPVSADELAANPNSRYLGRPLKVYNRYQFTYRDKVHAGFVAENDAGEEFFTGSNPYGFDHYAVHLQINDVGRFKTIAIGDYQPAFGQGLVLWSGLAFGKSANTLGVRKNARGIQKYSSTDENMYFRGSGLTWRISRNTEGSFFVSRKKIDAGISAVDPEGHILEVSSLQNTGLHATPSQVSGKKVLGETILGGNFTYNHRAFKIGATLASVSYDALLNPPERIYNQFDFRGDRNINIGLDYQFAIGPARFFGEGAVSSSGGTAAVGGVMANLSPLLSLSGLFRRYDRHYHAYFSNGFRENTRTANETGFYVGTLIQPARKWKFSAYIDIFSFPWIRYGAYSPSTGNEFFLQVDYNHSRNMHMYLSFRNKEKPVNAPAGDSQVRELFDSGLSRLRYHINYFISSSVEFRSRLELTQSTREDISPERGFLLYQDIFYRPSQLPLSFAFRYAVYQTDSYNARFYAYENDVLYSFSAPAYYDNGIRTYLMIQYSAWEAVDLWLRYALTKIPGNENMGSGLTTINGDIRSEIKAQLRVKF